MAEMNDLAAERYRFGSGGAGPYSERVSALREAKALFSALDEPLDVAWCDLDLGILSISSESTDLDQTLCHFRDARDKFRELEHSNGTAMAVAKIANVLAVQGQTAAAVEELEILDAMEVTDFVAIASLAGTWADLHLASGDTEGAVAALQRKLLAQRQAHRHRDLLATHVRIGRLLVTLGRLDEARGHADAAAEFRAVAGESEAAKLPCLQAEIEIKSGKPLLAMQHLDDALRRATRPWEQADLLLTQARMASRNGLRDVALDRFTQALDIANTAGLQRLQAQAHDGLAFAMQPNEPQALAHAIAALAISDDTDDHRLLTLSRRCARVVLTALGNDSISDHVDTVGRLEQLLSQLGAQREEWTVLQLVEAREELGDAVAARRAKRLTFR